MIKPFRASLKSIAIAMLFSSLTYAPAFSQNNTDKLPAAELLEMAKQLAKEKDYQKSTKLALRAIQKFEQLDDWEGFKDGYYRIFLNGYSSKDYNNSLALLKKGRESIPNDQALALAKINTYLGYSYEKIGDIISSVEAYEKSVEPFKKIKDTTSLNTVYNNLGLGYLQFSDYSKAIYYLKNAITLGKSLSDSTRAWLGIKALGQAYFYKGDLENARRNYVIAQKMIDLLDGRFEIYYAQIELQKKQYKKAINFAKKAILLAQRNKSNSKESALLFKKILAEIYLEAGQPNAALVLIHQILPFYKKGPNKRELAKLFLLMGDTFIELGKYDQALQAFQEALKTFIPDFKSKGINSNPKKNLQTRETYLPKIYQGKGYCFYQKYKATQKKKWLFQAEENYTLATDAIQNIKLNYDETESSLSIGDLTHSFYEDVIQTKLELFRLSGQSKYQEEAFQVAQQANAFVLRELLNEQKSMQAANVSNEIIKLLRQYRKAEILMRNRIEDESENHTGSQLDSLQKILFTLKNKQYNLRRTIEKEYPKFARLRNDLEVAGISELQKKLDDSSLLIKYFRGDQTLYIFSITSSDYSVDTINLPPDFDALIRQYRMVLSDLDFINSSTELAEQQYLRVAYRLYQLLLEKPLKKHNSNHTINRMTIVGDGVLSAIPFQALLLKKSKNWENPENLVLSQFAISYSYFCKMLLETSPQKENANTFISFGVEFDEYTLKYLQKISKDEIKNKAIKDHLRSGSFSALPFSDEEAKELAILMEGKSWINEEATKFNFLQSIPHAGIIHTATHSILDLENPNQSALVFIKTKDSLDNLLRLSEIYKLRLSAEMLVLSACSTGFGPMKKGEGINSLARAFRVAGVSSITATLWGISDESSKKIMTLYYEFLKAGLAKDIALQKAQLKFLRSDKVSSPAFRLPVYWAAWMLIGEKDSIRLGEEGFRFYLWLPVLFIFIFFSSVYFYRVLLK